MINLRYHIVSITAVFLALAVGVVMGAAFIDQGTVDLLQDRLDGLQRSVDDTRSENAFLRDVMAQDGEALAGLDARLPGLVDGILEDRAVLVVAMRGIDEEPVVRSVELLAAAGASVRGTLWLDSRLDTTNPDVLASLRDLFGYDGSDPEVRFQFLSDLDEAFGAVVDGPDAAGAAPDQGEGEDEDDPDPPPDEVIRAQEMVQALVDNGFADWVPTEGEEPPPTVLPDDDLSLVVVSGEGAELSPQQLLLPSLEGTASTDPLAVVVAEVMQQRSLDDAVALEQAEEDPALPRRGAFVDVYREEDALDGRLSTVDDLDQVLGRVALVLALDDLGLGRYGDYGVAPSAQSALPAGE